MLGAAKVNIYIYIYTYIYIYILKHSYKTFTKSCWKGNYDVCSIRWSFSDTSSKYAKHALSLKDADVN